MNLQHVNVKLFVEGDFGVDLDEVAKQFHDWISEQALDDVLIDVADYQHVPEGPSLVLVGLRSQYFIDMTGGKPGLLYTRKAALDADNNGQFAHSVASALDVAQRLESHFSNLKFSRTQVEFSVNDRAIAPSTPAAQAKFRDELEGYLSSIGQSGFSVNEERDPRALVGAVVSLQSPLAA